MIDELKLKPLYEKLIKGDIQPIREWVNKNPQEAVELVQKYLNIIKTKLNQKKASLKAQVKTKKPKKTRKKKIKKKTKKRKLKVKIGGGEPEPEPGTDDDICGICLDSLKLDGGESGEELLKCCGEIYHTKCLDKWTGPCPSCRAHLTRGNRSPSPAPRRTRTRVPSPTRYPLALRRRFSPVDLILEASTGLNSWENMLLLFTYLIVYSLYAGAEMHGAPWRVEIGLDYNPDDY